MAPRSEAHATHILHFYYDDDDACALTTLINDVRFHVIVDPKELQKSNNKPLYYEYLDKMSALREADERDEQEIEEAQPKTTNSKAKAKSLSQDSAVDVSADDEYNGDKEDDYGEDDDQDSGSAAVELQNWILSALSAVTEESAPPGREPEVATLDEWYHGPTYFYKLQIKGGELTPELLETTNDLNERIEKLVPHMRVPKYIQNIDVPWISAHDLIVKSEVPVPEPAHPGKVVHKETGEVYFFKPVDESQPGPFKREVQILQKVQSLDLNIKVPTLRGFVPSGNSKTKVMGLLLSHIENPKPLTTLLRPSVAKSKRCEWRKKSKQYIDILHQHDVIWGDAKADNFLVDEHDELWIIDFGGSYTEGWVDIELTETKEGDKQGLEKVMAALEDPKKNTLDPVGSAGDRVEEIKETASLLFVTERKVHESRKRMRDEHDEGEDSEEDATSKRLRGGKGAQAVD